MKVTSIFKRLFLLPLIALTIILMGILGKSYAVAAESIDSRLADSIDLKSIRPDDNLEYELVYTSTEYGTPVSTGIETRATNSCDGLRPISQVFVYKVKHPNGKTYFDLSVVSSVNPISCDQIIWINKGSVRVSATNGSLTFGEAFQQRFPSLRQATLYHTGLTSINPSNQYKLSWSYNIITTKGDTYNYSGSVIK